MFNNSFLVNLICLSWFYGKSAIVGYLMSNPFFYIKYMIYKHIL